MCGPVRATPGGRVEKIVVAGGYPAREKVEVYEISTNSWESGGWIFLGGSFSSISMFILSLSRNEELFKFQDTSCLLD